MTLRDLLQTIISSSRPDWYTMLCLGPHSGPSYRDKLEFYEIYEGRHNVLHSASHEMVASYKADLSITMAWGLTANTNFDETWATTFPDPSASSHHVDVFFNNALVYRDSFVSVDGGRAKLPLPRRRDELVVPRSYCSFIKLLDEMEAYVSDYDRYFKQAGLRMIEREWPE